jgi:hypothetical protein
MPVRSRDVSALVAMQARRHDVAHAERLQRDGVVTESDKELHMPGDIFLNRDRFTEIIFRYPCPQRILIVADGGLGFDPANGGGLTEFMSVIQTGGHTLSTAHRTGDAFATIPGSFNFNTAATPVTVANYDQIWMFGISATPLLAPEQTRIEAFMQAGGGVFATGDHSSLGFGMGAHIPRARWMRNWSSIPMSSPQRLDTVIDPGTNNIKEFQDQADAIAQRIYPVFFSNGGPDSSPSTWAVHPVLRHASGAVDFLPDHPHESECLAPTPGPGNFSAFEEWPAPLAGGGRIAPVVAAVAMSAGRFVTDSLKPPVYPRSFGAISAYDGDPAHVGRIVCDATWHHFVNINLNGVGAGNDPLTGLPREGLKPGGVPTPEYLKIQAYYRNTVRWLAPRNRRYCWPFLIAAIARFDIEALELQLPHPHPCPWDPLVKIGRTMQDVIDGQFGPGTMASVVDDMLGTLGEGSGLEALLDSRKLAQRKEGVESLLPVADMRRAVFASLVNLLADKLPRNERELEAIIKDHDRVALDTIGESLKAAEAAIAVQLERALKEAGNDFSLLGKRPAARSVAENAKSLAAVAIRPRRQAATKAETSARKKAR